MFSISLHRAGHVRQYSVRATPGDGWEVSVLEDHTLTRHVRYHDWHRLERTIALFHRDVADLTAQGWEVLSPDPQHS